MPSIWLNGRFVDESDASISIRDAGLLHAAGVFTTMRSHDGRVFQLAQHLKRLRDSCEALFIPLVYPDETLILAVRQLLETNQLSEARLRLTITRGQATNDPVHGMRLEPNVFLTAAPLEPYPADFYQRGMTVMLLDEQKLNPYDVQAGHKTLNYFSRLSALREANRRGAGEAIWFNVHNYLQSGSISNIFVVKGATLLTPPTPGEMLDPAIRQALPYPKSAVLPGIIREAVLESARLAGVQVQLSAIDVNQLLEADEVFLTNSIMQVMPVCRVERHAIGNDRPGPVTSELGRRIEEQISAAK